MYKWASDELYDNHWLIKFLQRKFNVLGVKSLKVANTQDESICPDDMDEDPELCYFDRKRDEIQS